MGPNVYSLGFSSTHLGAGHNRGEVLWPKSWFFPLCPGIEEVEWLAQQGGKGHRIPDNGTAARFLCSVYFYHSLPPGLSLSFPGGRSLDPCGRRLAFQPLCQIGKPIP